MQPQHTSSGNALVEYGLPLMLILGMGGVLGTLTDFPKMTQQYFQSTQHGSLQGNTLHISSLGTNVVQPQPSLTAIKTAAPNNVTPGKVCLSSGICIQVPVIAGGVISETLGGLGGNLTSSLADVLDQLVTQLQAQKADPSLIHLVTKLALDGHQLGNNINILEKYCPLGAVDCYSNPPNTNIETDPSFTITNPDIMNGDQHVGVNTSSFQQDLATLNQYLNSHSDLTAVSAIVNAESSQILTISNGLDIVHTEYEGASTSKINTAANNGVLVHQDSNTICNQGGQSICIQ